jgi:SAM-dependent methyltransferase
MPPPRLQLFEFNDTPGVPRFVRETLVESLSRALAWGHMLRDLVPPFHDFLRRTGASEVLDVGAGAGGPAGIIVDELLAAGLEPPRIILTDLHPQLESWEALKERHPRYIDYVAEPVDGSAIPPDLARGRVTTIHNVLHHFPPNLAEEVVRSSLERSAGLFISEAFERTPLGFAAFGPPGVAALLANPLLTPRRKIAKAIFTWLTPLALAVSIWDGLVSTMRIYTEEELRAMVGDAARSFHYRRYAIGRLGHGYYFAGARAQPL